MSRVAGLFQIVLSCLAGYFLYNDYIHPGATMPKYAIQSTAAVAGLLFLIGLLHFRAPHKAFLMSIPVLLAYLAMAHVDMIYYYGVPRWKYEGGLIAVSVLILVLSYRGYLSRKSQPS